MNKLKIIVSRFRLELCIRIILVQVMIRLFYLRLGVFVCLLFMFVSCSSEPISVEKFEGFTKVTFSWRHVDSTTYLEGQVINPGLYLSRARDLILINDHLVIAGIDPEALITAIPLNMPEKSKTFGKKGYGPGEIMTAVTLDQGIEASRFWTYSKNQKMWSEFELFGKNKLASRQMPLKDGLFQMSTPLWVGSNSFLGRNLDGEAILTEFDSSGNKLDQYGNWRNYFEKDIPGNVLASVFRSEFHAGAERKKFVLAAIALDHLQVFDYERKSMLAIQGPDHFEPEFKIIEVKGYPVYSPVEKETAYAYLDVFIGSTEYYGLYSGSFEAYKRGDAISNQIIAIDQKSYNPRLIKLDRNISRFTIDEKNGYLYAVTFEESPKIVRYVL